MKPIGKRPNPFIKISSSRPIQFIIQRSRLDKIEESRKDWRHVARTYGSSTRTGKLIENNKFRGDKRQGEIHPSGPTLVGGIKRTKEERNYALFLEDRGRDPSRGVACNGAETATVESTFDRVRLGRDMKNASNAPVQVHGYTFSDQKLSGRGSFDRAYPFSFWLTKDLQRGTAENWVEKELFLTRARPSSPIFKD